MNRFAGRLGVLAATLLLLGVSSCVDTSLNLKVKDAVDGGVVADAGDAQPEVAPGDVPGDLPADDLPAGDLPATDRWCCTPLCNGKECGSDGCGNTCGGGCADERVDQGDDTLTCLGYDCVPAGDECEDGGDYPWDGCGAGLLTEFLVNVESAGSQRDPAVAALAGGEYVVVWETQAYEGAGWEIAGRIFDVSVAFNTGVEQIGNDYSDGHQTNPAVAPLAGGGFVVAWQGGDPESAVFESRIFARRFDSEGQPQGPSYVVSGDSETEQRNPAVAGRVGGGFAVAWQGDVYLNTEGDDDWNVPVHARHVSADDGPGAIVKLSPEESGHTDAPAVSALPDGGSLTVWAGEYDESGLLGPLRAQVGANGELLNFSSFPAAENPGYYEGLDAAIFPPGRAPDVEGSLAEAFVVMERDNSDFGGDIYAQMMAGDGTPLWSQFKVNLLDSNDPDPIDQQVPEVAILTDGSVAVVWDTYSYTFDNGGEGLDVHLQVLAFTPFTPQLSSLPDTDPRANRYVRGDQSNPDVASLPDGSFVVVWESCPEEGSPGFAQDESGCGVFAQRFRPDGPRIEPWQEFTAF